MIGSVSSTASLYPSLKPLQTARQQEPANGETGGQPVFAPLINDTSQGMSRSLAREAALSSNAADALTTQYIGPARAAARSEALEPRPAQGVHMAAYYQDLMNGCQAGPKPVSVMAAEANYVKARSIFG